MTGNMTDSDTTPRLLPIAEAAAAMGVSERTIWRRIRSGKLSTIDIGGRACVQLPAVTDSPTMTGGGVTVTGKTTDNTPDSVTRLQDEIKSQYRARIEGLEQENSRLWREIESKQGTIDNLTRMLPAPKSTGDNTGGDQARRGAPQWVWLVLAGAILTAAGVGGYWLWLTQ